MNPFSTAAGEGARTCTLSVSIAALPAGARRLVEIDLTGATFDGEGLPARFEELSGVYFETTAGLLVMREAALDGEYWDARDADNRALALLHAGRVRLVIENISGAQLDANGLRLLLRGAACSPVPRGYVLPGLLALSGDAGEFEWQAPAGAILASVATPLLTGGGAVLATDERLSDARTPTAHAASHGAGGADALILTSAQISDLTAQIDAAIAALVADDDARLLDDNLFLDLAGTDETIALSIAQCRAKNVYLVGTLTANKTIEFLNQNRTWNIIDLTARAGFDISVRKPGGTSISVATGERLTIYATGN